MVSKTFKYTAFTLKIIEKILGSKFVVSGIKDLPNQPILFVCNHFTRFETFVVPYLIYKNTNRQVRCLADSSLFHGILGKFLSSVGTLSTKDANRDQIILNDLITGNYDWMIYPEGSMIKSKEIKRDSGFVNYTPSRVGKVRTGSAIIALKSQLYRDEMNAAFKQNKMDILAKLESEFTLKYQEDLIEKNTYIVPLNISYYPIRPGENKIQKLAAKLIKKIPRQIAEELEIEGNLLLESEININFGKAINLAEYIRPVKGLIKQVPLIKKETKSNFILKYFKFRLTNDFMEKIYSDLQINLDHIFASTLSSLAENNQKIVEIDHLKRIIYLSANMLDRRKYRIHPSIFEENLLEIFISDNFKPFSEVLSLAEKQNLVRKIDDKKIEICFDCINHQFEFHEIRRENTLRVINNEFSLLREAKKIIAKNCLIDFETLKKRVFDEIYQTDLINFEEDYQTFYDEKFSKNKSVGSPFFLDNIKNENSDKVGILFCHGYKSAPKEVAEIAKYFNQKNYKTYAVRLKGHGTAPINMKNITYFDWFKSLIRGYAALKNQCDEVVVIGFSTGGLLALLAAHYKFKNLKSLIVINAALKLMDIRARWVAGVNLWNELLEKIKIDSAKFEYVDDKPENPDINYSRNYLKAVEQLNQLMHKVDEILLTIETPVMVIQSNNDPVVNPISGEIIFNKISSKEKIFYQPEMNNHCIINGEKKEIIFSEINNFLNKLDQN
jgi:esterase/lipase/1-acyl-sn-glycerol-3-phosphate acyltransferase